MQVHNIYRLWLPGVFRRNAFVAFAAVLTAFFLMLLFPAANVHAADATWKDGSVVYDGDTYQGPRQATGDNPPGIPDGATYYEAQKDGLARIVYFTDDPTSATSARMATYVVDGDKYSQTKTSQSISIDKQTDVAADTSSEEKEITSCVVNGIGYFVCPIIQFMADATDTMFGYLENFLQVEPLTSGKDSTLERAWKIARNIANVLFIIVFIIIIYAYLTGAGLNNYDLKKTIPRMLVAAAAVNLSYYICAILVDVSNIAGSSLNQIFISVVNEVGKGADENILASIGFSELSTYVLSGGTIAAVGAFQGALALSQMGSGILFLFIVILLPIATIILVTVAVLAARLAIITVLIVLAPLAFVAYILPGTKQLYDKWQDLFTTMLLMYPLFAILFGGSHLASYLIAQNADRWETVLIALFVQAVPLVITPFLIRFSGRLLGRFAGMVNNPTKGMADKTKAWAKDRALENTERRLANGGVGVGLARWDYDRKQAREGRRSNYKNRNALRYARSQMGRSVTMESWDINDDKAIFDNDLATNYSDRKIAKDAQGNIINHAAHTRALQLKNSELQANLSKARVDGFLEDIQSKEGRDHFYGEHPVNIDEAVFRARADKIGEVSLSTMAQAAARERALNARRIEYAKAIQEDGSALRTEAAGSAGKLGEHVSLANAIKDTRADFGKASATMEEMFDHYKLSGEEIKKLADGSASIQRKDANGRVVFEFNPTDEYTRDAAISANLNKTGNYSMQLDTILMSGTKGMEGYRGTISGGLGKFLERSGMSGVFIDKVRSGEISSMADYTQEIQNAIKAGKIKATTLVKMDAGAVKDWYNAAAAMDRSDPEVDSAVQNFALAAQKALAEEQIAADIQNNAIKHIKNISDL